MKSNIKKILLQLQLSDIELCESEELFTLYNQEFAIAFSDELLYLSHDKSIVQGEIDASKSIKKPLKILQTGIEDSCTRISELAQKLYRILAKKLHPDVSEIGECESAFKKLATFSDNDDLLNIILLSLQYELELPSFTDDECFLITEQLKTKQDNIANVRSRIAWIWATNNTQPNIEAIVYKVLKLDKESFVEWKKNN